jgi:mono/diheme cytochrome c family protein
MKWLGLVTFTLCLAMAAWAGAKPERTSRKPVADGEQVYKTNCTRCHNTPPSLTERETRAVVLHMRVRANLVADQADAALQYLAESAQRK